MTYTATHTEASPAARTATALQGIEAAAVGLTAAKRTRSADVIAHAQHELRVAVHAARDLDVQWGSIGSALGIARGNAYQRYRR